MLQLWHKQDPRNTQIITVGCLDSNTGGGDKQKNNNKKNVLHSKVQKACGGDNCPTKEVALAGAQQSGLWQE